MSPVGIDFGTTSSSVAVCRNGKVDIIPNSFSSRSTPSCAVFAETERFVGTPAFYQLTKHYKNSIVDVKRILGRDYDDTKLQVDAIRWPFTMRRVDKRAAIEICYKDERMDLAPEEVAAMLLNNLTETAASHLGGDVGKVVIAVPASFNDRQRRAMIDAARIADLNDVRLVNETTAAAIAYAYNTKPTERNVLVYDLGGGTFDVAVVKIQEGPKVRVLASRGDSQLGSIDFDSLLLGDLAEEFKKLNNIDVFQNQKAVLRLWIAVERAKQDLTGLPDTNIDVDALMDGVDFNTNITRERFENLCGGLFRSTMDHVVNVLDDAGLKKSDIEEVLLVGGSTRIPMIKRLVEEFFPDTPVKDTTNSDDCVAKGAAILAAHLSENSDVSLVDETTSHRIQVDVNGNRRNIFKRNTFIPCKETFLGSNFNVIEDDLQIGCCRLDDGAEEVDVSFKINCDGILEITSDDASMFHEAEGKGLTEEEIETLKNKAKRYTEDDEAERERCESRNQLEQNVYFLKETIASYHFNNELMNELNDSCEKTLKWLESNWSATSEQYRRRQNELQKDYRVAYRAVRVTPEEPVPDNRGYVIRNCIKYGAILVTVLALARKFVDGTELRRLVCKCLRFNCRCICFCSKLVCNTALRVLTFVPRAVFGVGRYMFMRSINWVWYGYDSGLWLLQNHDYTGL